MSRALKRAPTPPSAWQIGQVVSLAQATLSALREDHGQIIDTADELAEALAGEQVDVAAILRRLVIVSIEAKANAAIAGERIEHLQARIARFKRSDERARATMVDILGALTVPGFADPEFTLSVRPGSQRLVISDEAALPADLVDIETVASPAKDRIRALLDAGEAVAGATLSNGPPVLTIRTK